MIRLLLPETEFVGSFIATNPGIAIQQIELTMHKYLVLITQSSKKSYKGFKINSIYKPSYLSRNTHDGGPINLGTEYFMIHTNDFCELKTKKINEYISYTAIPSKDYVKDIANPPKHHLIVTGHMSWSKGQLEEEMLNGIWMCVKFDQHILFNVPVVDKWNKAYDLSGIIPERIGIHDSNI